MSSVSFSPSMDDVTVIERRYTRSLTSLNDDVLDLICRVLFKLSHRDALWTSSQTKCYWSSLKSLSLTCTRLRAMCAPYLFDSFKLVFAFNTTWEDAASKLQAWNNNWCRFVREINISMTLGRLVEQSGAPFVATIPDTLASILSEIATTSFHLRKMSIQIQEAEVHRFETAFKARSLHFPNVETFSVMLDAETISTLCPNATTLSVLRAYNCGPRICERLTKALNNHPRLECLYLNHVTYTNDVMDAVYEAKPDLKRLFLPAHLAPNIGFEEFVRIVSRFRKLEILSIPAAAYLQLGCHVPQCTRGNPDVAGQRRRYEEYGRKKKEVEEHAAATFFGRCLNLRELYVGTNVKAVMNPAGNETSSRTDYEWSRSLVSLLP